MRTVHASWLIVIPVIMMQGGIVQRMIIRIVAARGTVVPQMNRASMGFAD